MEHRTPDPHPPSPDLRPHSPLDTHTNGCAHIYMYSARQSLQK